jgi:hypothetical protein
MYTFTNVLKEGGRRNPHFVRWVCCKCRVFETHRMSRFSFALCIHMLEQRILLCTIWKEYHGEYWWSTLITTDSWKSFTHDTCIDNASFNVAALRSRPTHLKWSKSVIKSWHRFPRLYIAYWLSMLLRGLEWFGRWRKSWLMREQPPKSKW